MQLADRAQAVKTSQTIRLDTAAKALQQAGQVIANLTVGELNFSTPQSVQQAVVVAAQGNTNHYSAVAGQVPARQAVVDYLQLHHELQYGVDQVVVTNGVKQGLYVCMQVLVNPGDEVLIIEPAWGSYHEQVKLAGGVPVGVQSTELFQPDLNALGAAVTGRTVGVIINYPNNPTGAVYDPAMLQALADFVRQHNLWVISDEIYEQLLYDNAKFKSFAHYCPEAIVVNGLSKVVAIAGWRVGYVVGPLQFIERFTAVQSQLCGNVSNVMQMAIAPALATGLPADWLTQLYKRRQQVIDWVHSQPRLTVIPPQGAFYGFINISQVTADSEEFCEHLLQEHHVALVPGAYFGRDGFVRLSFAHSDSAIATGLQGFADCIAEHYKL